MELVACNHRVGRFAHLSDFADHGAHLVVFRHRGTQRSVGGVHAEDLGQPVQHVHAHLLDVCVDVIVRDLQRHVRVGDEEIRLLVDVQDLEMLHGAIHGRTRVHADHRVQKLIAALNGALDQRSCIVAGVVGHVIGRDVQRTGFRRSQPNRETAIHVEDDLRNMEAGIAERDAALSLRLTDKRIVRIFQEIFKVDQMLQIFQNDPFFLLNFML